MGLFGNLFTKKYKSKQLVKAYKSQGRDKYDFLTFSKLECSKNNVLDKDFIQIFSEAHDVLKNENKLSQEEIWIFLDLGIHLKLGKIDLANFRTRQIMTLPKLTQIYSIFIQYTEEEREIISLISHWMWASKVTILNNENRIADGDDAYDVYNKLETYDQKLWERYNDELRQKIV